MKNTGSEQSWTERILTTIDILKNGNDYAQELIQTRCTRGADVARELRFSEAVAQGIHSLDEHWNGQGRPEQRKGEAIPLFSRIALLAQVFDVFKWSTASKKPCKRLWHAAVCGLIPNWLRSLSSLLKILVFIRTESHRYQSAGHEFTSRSGPFTFG